jgi:hypothetical protein
MVTVKEIQQQIERGEEVVYENADIEAWKVDISSDLGLAAPVRLLHCTTRGDEHCIAGVYVPAEAGITVVRGISRAEPSVIEAQEITDALESGESIALINARVIGSVHRWRARRPVKAGSLIIRNTSFQQPARGAGVSLHIAGVEFRSLVELSGVSCEGGVEFSQITCHSVFDWMGSPGSPLDRNQRSEVDGHVQIGNATFHSDVNLHFMDVRHSLQLSDCDFRAQFSFRGNTVGAGPMLLKNMFNKRTSFGGDCQGGRCWHFDGSRFHQGASFGEGVLRRDVSLKSCDIAGHVDVPHDYWIRIAWPTRFLDWLHRPLTRFFGYGWFHNQLRRPQLDVTQTNADDCTSMLFRRWVQDTNYLEQFKARHRFIHWLWLVTSDCGRSISLWVVWSVILAVLFGLIFHTYSQDFLVGGRDPLTLFDAMYFSIVTFTTLGLGDVLPVTNVGKVLVIAEVVAGYLMLGGLISIFAEKMIRKS